MSSELAYATAGPLEGPPSEPSDTACRTGPEVAPTVARNVAAAIDLLERQACNCLPAPGKRARVRCLRCELLELLGAKP